MKKSIAFLILALFLLPSIASAQLADSQSPTLKVNSKHTGQSEYATNIEKPVLKWKFDTGDGVESSPVIGPDGTIYISSHSKNFFAINSDGTEKWRFTKENYHFRSTPTLDKDGTIYLPAIDIKVNQFSEHLGKSVDGGTPVLFALNPDGSEKWEFELGGIMSGMMYCATIADDGTIYMISGGADMEGSEGGGDRFYAINPDGTEKWNFPTEDAMYSAAALADDGTIYFGSADGYFYALNPDGTLKWKYSTGPDAKSRDDIWDAVPSIGTDGTVYIGSYDQNLYAFNPDGTVKWKFKTDYKIEATASIADDGTIYTGTYSPSDDKYLYALNQDGILKWKYETEQGVDATPAIDANGILYFASYDGYLYSLNPDGTERWKYKTDAGIMQPPAIDKNGVVYFGTWDNNLYAITGGESDVNIDKSSDKNKKLFAIFIPIFAIVVTMTIVIYMQKNKK